MKYLRQCKSFRDVVNRIYSPECRIYAYQLLLRSDIILVDSNSDDNSLNLISHFTYWSVLKKHKYEFAFEIINRICRTWKFNKISAEDMAAQ